MKLPTITDSRGNKSSTLFFVVCALVALLARFVAGMFTDLGQIDAMSFAGAFTTIIVPWIAREGIEKVTLPPSDPFQIPPGA